MLEKGTPPESSGDEHTMETSDSDVQQQLTAQPAGLTLISDTTLPDLPIEMLELILVQVIAMEVKAMKLAKSAWNEKADLVISRLKAVCSKWNTVLSTDFFQNEVHRNLDGTAPETIRMEVLLQPSIQSSYSAVDKVIAMRDEIFILCNKNLGQDQFIKVYDRNDMADLKGVVPLPGIHVPSNNGLAACNVSNSLYAIHGGRQQGKWPCLAVWRIARDEEHQFHVSPWLSDLGLPLSGIYASSSGSIIILSLPGEESNATVRIYDANASLQHKILLPEEFSCPMSDGKVIQRSNGNLVLVSLNWCFNQEPRMTEVGLTEIDLTGRILRRYISSKIGGRPSCAAFADMHGRILLSDIEDRMELLDSEFNLLDFTGPQLVRGKLSVSYETYYNHARNEIVGLPQFGGFIIIFRFIEE